MPIRILGESLGGDPDFPKAELREIPCVLGHTNYFFFQLLFVIRGLSAGDSPRLMGSEWGSPPGQGGAPKAETNERPT